MKAQLFDEKMLDTAWLEIEHTLTSTSMAEPAPGFVNRFKHQLMLQRQAEQRRQAWIFVAINTVAAFMLLGLIALLYLPGLSGPSDLLIGIARVFSSLVVSIKMIGGLIVSIARTLPGIVPISWWMGIMTSLSLLSLVWLSMVRQVFQKQGVTR